MLFNGVNLVDGAESDTIILTQGSELPSTTLIGELFFLESSTPPGPVMYTSTNGWINLLTSLDNLANLLPMTTAPGTYTKVTVGANGLVTAGANPTTIAGYGITDAQPLNIDLTNIASAANMYGAVGYLKKQTNGLWSLDPTLSMGITAKAAVQVMATTNITLSGLQTIDGYTTVAGDRVLLTQQTNTTQNLVYIAGTGAWTLPLDFQGTEAQPGDIVYVENGTINGGTTWIIINNSPITAGTTNVGWAILSRAGGLTNVGGLIISGNNISIGTASSSRIVVNFNSIDLATTGITPGSYYGVTIDAYGRANAGVTQVPWSVISGTPTTRAGYGITDVQPLNSNLTALSGVAATGLLSFTAAGTVAERQIIVSGSGISIINSDGVMGNPTISLNSTNANTANTLVSRDSSGNFSANVITAALTGNATSATNLAGGATGGVPYQTATGATGYLAAGTTSQVLISGASGPTWSGTPALVGTNFTGIPNAALNNSSLTLGSTAISLGSTVSTIAGLISVTSTLFTGTLAGNATSSTTSVTATNVAGGAAGSLVYQSGASSTTTLPIGAATQVLIGGSSAPSWSSAPSLLGTNFTGIPNAGLNNSNITLGSTSISLGASTSTLAGLTVVTSASFIGALTGNADTSTKVLTTASTSNASFYLTMVGTGTGGNQSVITSTLFTFNPSTGALNATLFNGSGAGLTSIPNSALNNSSVTIGSTNVSLGSTVTAFAGLTSVTSTLFTGTLAGNASSASNLTGGAAGSLVYQTGSGVTAMLAAGSSSQVLVSGSTPSWSSAPSLLGTNFTGIPNAALNNSNITLGSTTIALGSSSTTIAGLTSVTSTSFIGALTGNADTATKLATARTISATGDASWTTSFDGSGNATGTLTLQNVYTAPLVTGFVKVTFNLKGLVTNSSPVTNSDITSSLGYTPVNNLGDTMYGPLNMGGFKIASVADPLSPQDAATKNYVDGVLAGLSWKQEVAAGTVGDLGSVVYNNGSSGVGATLTNNGTQAAFVIDGYSAQLNDRILVKNQISALQNGIYTVTTVGNSSTNWVLTRTLDDDAGHKMTGAATFCGSGTVQMNTGWVQSATNPNIGTDSIVWVQFTGGTASYTGTSGINITGTTISNTGVLSLTGTGSQITVSAAAGNVTLSLPSTITISGLMSAGTFTGSGSGLTSIPNSALNNSNVTIGSTAINLGSTSTTLAGLTSVTSTSFTGALTGNATTSTTASNVTGGAAGSLVYQTGSGATSTLAAGTSSQVLVSGTTPSWSSAPSILGTNITGIPNAGLLNSSITFTAGTGLSGGGTVGLGGTVAFANAGVLTLVAGTDTSVSSSTGNVTVGNTSTLATVTSRGASTSTLVALNGGATSVTPALTDNSLNVATTAWAQGLLNNALTLSVAGSANVTLTALQAANPMLIFTGALTGNISVIVPTSTKAYIVANRTSGAYTLTVKTVAGTGIAVTQGNTQDLWCDGTNVVLATNDFPNITLLGEASVLGAGANIRFSYNNNGNDTYIFQGSGNALNFSSGSYQNTSGTSVATNTAGSNFSFGPTGFSFNTYTGATLGSAPTAFTLFQATQTNLTYNNYTTGASVFSVSQAGAGIFASTLSAAGAITGSSSSNPVSLGGGGITNGLGSDGTNLLLRAVTTGGGIFWQSPSGGANWGYVNSTGLNITGTAVFSGLISSTGSGIQVASGYSIQWGTGNSYISGTASGTINVIAGGTTAASFGVGTSTRFAVQNSGTGQTLILATGVAGNLFVDYLGSGSNYIDGGTTYLRTFAGTAYATFSSSAITFTPSLTLNSGLTVTGTSTFGDIFASRSSTTGVVYLGTSGTHYLFYDGSNYNMPTGGLVLGGGIQAAGNSYIYSSTVSGLIYMGSSGANYFSVSSGVGTILTTGGLNITGGGDTLGLLIGPNATWGKYLRVGGYSTATTYATVQTTNGDLHIGSAASQSIYLNYYNTSGYIYFGGSSYYVGSGGALVMNTGNFAGGVTAYGNIYVPSGGSLLSGVNVYTGFASAAGGGYYFGSSGAFQINCDATNLNFNASSVTIASMSTSVFTVNRQINLTGSYILNFPGSPSSAFAVGSGVSSGLYYDTANIAIRALNVVGSTLYFQAYAGSATWATWNATACNFYLPVALAAYTVSGLPAAATVAGALCYVTDATATTYRSAPAGGGSNHVLVLSTGSSWVIV